LSKDGGFDTFDSCDIESVASVATNGGGISEVVVDEGVILAILLDDVVDNA
jgi:hypothetical protein